jgi:hypothetical protein
MRAGTAKERRKRSSGNATGSLVTQMKRHAFSTVEYT